MTVDDQRTPLLGPESARAAARWGPLGGLRSGDRLGGGRFLIRERLGSGGSGVVYAALDTAVGQKVAVKVLRPELADDKNLERLRREVRAARPGHPNIVTVYDLHEHEGVPFLSMELVAGRSLGEALAERSRLPAEEVAAIGAQVAAGLAHLHRSGLVHRDVKPGNILLAADGTARLCDLGLVRPTAPGVTVTETAMMLGTPAYMAPEQGAASGLTAASDVYALGVTLYRCLSGAVPLEGSSAVQTVVLRQESPPPRFAGPAASAPRWLQRLLRRMLEPDPRDRPSAEAAAAAMRRHALPWRPARRQLRRAVGWLVFGAAAAAVAVSVRWLLLPPRADPGSPLLVRSTAFDNGTTLAISDGSGVILWETVLDHPWEPLVMGRSSRRPVAFGDLDGDGLEDAVIAHRSTAVSEPLEILVRQRDGTLRRAAAFPATEGYEYEGERFTRFRPNDVHCADLDGDGAAEIVLAEHSAGLYPAVLRVLRGDGGELLRLWHPGVLHGCMSGDRDGDGRPELYVGGTCNFLTPPGSNTSRPVLLVLEADWGRGGRIVDLFGPGRTLRPPSTPGVRLLYAAWPRVDRPPYQTPWQEAVAVLGSALDQPTFLTAEVSTANPSSLGLVSDRRITLRHVFFDSELRVTGAQWNPVVVGPLAIDPADPEMQALLRPAYWTGDGWSPEPIFMGDMD